MTAEDFVIKYLRLLDDKNYNTDTIRLLAAIVDTSKDGLISYSEFQAFEGLLCFPDALYKTAFQLFDTNGNGMVSFRKYFYLLLRGMIIFKTRKYLIFSTCQTNTQKLFFLIAVCHYKYVVEVLD